MMMEHIELNITCQLIGKFFFAVIEVIVGQNEFDKNDQKKFFMACIGRLGWLACTSL